MFHVDNNTGVPVMPAVSPLYSALRLFFTEGGNGIPPTYPGPDWFNTVQSELLNILDQAGIDPDKADATQLLTAFTRLFLSRENPFADIKADGPAAVAQGLANLGLGDIALAGVGGGMLSGNGYIALPLIISGVKRTFIIQWGVTTSSSTATAVVTFQTTFPNAICGVLTGAPSAYSSYISNSSGESLTGMNINCYSSVGGSPVRVVNPVFWLAWGY
ncbi:hypothetical protein [Mangrovibacter phragmitis]|uniref:gp53-like domain-containing protein n=1 Tax=Mangrovibacter phragmitis TaxID=1691903 RepID=UPI00336A2406